MEKDSLTLPQRHTPLHCAPPDQPFSIIFKFLQKFKIFKNEFTDNWTSIWDKIEYTRLSAPSH